MDVGAADLSNVAGSHIHNPPGGVSNTIANITNTSNIFANAGWWTPSSNIVTAPGNTDVMNQLCRVCGEPAAGFHFGAFTCEGCKSFFGRTYNNLGSISECKNGGVCVINKKNRTACKACRLRKCLMVGMSKSGSRYGRRSNWFKIHCLLQEQSHQAQQARLKDPTKVSFEKVLNSLDAANNNSSTNFPAASATNSPMNQGRLMKPEDVDPQSPRPQLRPDLLSHDLLRPEPNHFPLWRGPPFFHPAALNHMQLLNTPFFPFQQRFVVPYVNQVSPQMPVTSLSSSSSESVSPRSTPSPKIHHEDDEGDGGNEEKGKEEEQEEDEDDDQVVKHNQDDSFQVADKSLAFLRSLGPEQDEPIDLSKKPSEVNLKNDDEYGDNKSTDNDNDNDDHQLIDNKLQRFLESESDGAIENGPPLDLTWKT